MSFDLQKVIESKKAMRQQLAARPIEEKLAMLDALRERHLAIRNSEAAPVRTPISAFGSHLLYSKPGV